MYAQLQHVVTVNACSICKQQIIIVLAEKPAKGRLLCSGAQATTLRLRCFGDSGLATVLLQMSMNLCAPITDPVMMVLQAKASKGT